MIASVVAREQPLTDPYPWFSAVRRALKRTKHPRFGIAQRYAVTLLAALVFLPGCASPQAAEERSAQVTGLPSQLNGQRQRVPAPGPAQRQPLSAATEHLAQSIRQSGDNQHLPFLIIDKQAASVAAFDARGRLLGVSPALLGWARGDHSVPGIGERPIAKIRPHERTTPAGRFVVEMGRNMQGEDIVWIDYDAAVSLHRVRATNAAERRLERLASPSPLDNRISYGCINVPVRYFDDVVEPLMSGGKAIGYVLPEVKSAQEVFAFLRSGSPTHAQGKGENGNRAVRPGLIPVLRAN